MISEYLINNKFFLKEKISIECAREIFQSNWSSNHEWLDIEKESDILLIRDHEFVFIYNNIKFIYFCDTDLFMKLHCNSKSEIRENNLNKLIN
jgi:hypothetical protein